MADGFPNPISPCQPPATAAASTSTKRAPESLGADHATVREKIRALVVDDQSMAREVLRHMLKREGDVEVIGMSTNGREAVTAIHEMKPDLVFLDVQMPELDGFGVVSEIGPARMPPFIVVTANHDYSRAFEAHALDCLLKPCGRDRLHAALDRARARLGHRSLPQ